MYAEITLQMNRHFDINKLNHKVEYSSGIMSEEICQMMKEFFVKLRNAKG